MGGAKRNLSVNIELETLEVKIYANFLPFFHKILNWTIFHLEDNFCAPYILFQPYVGDFMQNFRTLGLIIKKGRHLFIVSDKSWNII